jgi:hypothetical protein
MLGKQLLYLLAITATLSTLVIQFDDRSALAISAEEVGQQRGRETVQANSLQNLTTFESSLPKCLASFIIGAHIIYVSKKLLK